MNMDEGGGRVACPLDCKVHTSANTADLAGVFVSIATNQNVATLLESEIAKRMSEAVSDKLSLEYFGS